MHGEGAAANYGLLLQLKTDVFSQMVRYEKEFDGVQDVFELQVRVYP